MLFFLWVIFSYLLGSIPFGYLIGRLSGKNVLKIGWRKTSGSNVFNNVGKWQGILTGILDVAKGYLAVYGAQKLGFSTEVQIISGISAVCGHNWSIFLKFAGGRGIGTFFGGFLALSPFILGICLIPFIFLALIWNASIGTLVFLFLAIYLSDYLSQFETAGFFTLLVLPPIFIKRLSPIKEIFEKEKPWSLFTNRLLFDNDEKRLDFRIKRFYQRHPEKVKGVIRTVSAPVWLPPKIGWEAAKFGVKVAKKPIQLLMGFAPAKVVTELGQAEIKKMFLQSSRKIVERQEEINRINVWPVADKDTGYNLAATLLGIEGVISQREYNSISELAQDVREAAMINARGNAGMIFTGYLIRFLEQIKNLEKVDALRLALAMKKGTKAARHSIINPSEGTILDVMNAAGRKTYEIAKADKEKNIIKILEEAREAGNTALEETKEKMEILKQNDVVDAGGLGFLKILEAWLESLKGASVIPENNGRLIAAEVKSEGKLEYRYDIVFQLKSIKEAELEKLKGELNSIGNSIDVLESAGRAKIHIHANFPDKVKEKIAGFNILQWKVEDMDAQIKKIRKLQPLGVIAEESADLPKEFLEKNHILEVPFSTRFSDGETVTKENLFAKLEEALKTKRPLPKTAAPSFNDFLSAYQKALDMFEEVLTITVSSKLSGAYSSARIARSMVKEKQRITVFDCFTAGIGEGLAVFKIQELISEGKSKQEILEILKTFCPKIKVIGGLKDLSFPIRSGRLVIARPLAGIVSFFSKRGLWFLFSIQSGKVRFFGLRLGKDLSEILIREIEKQAAGRELKVAIAYGNNLKEALQFKKELEKKKKINKFDSAASSTKINKFDSAASAAKINKFDSAASAAKIKVLFLSQVSAVVGVYTGPQILMVGFYSE